MANLGTLGIPGSELVGLPQPQGGGWFIAMFSGATTAIPLGWALCDGTGGLPDLRDRFLVGAGSTYAVAATGGATGNTPTFNGNASSTLNESTHTHSGTSLVVAYNTRNVTAGADPAVDANTGPTITGSTGAGTAHSHGYTPTGSITLVPTLPPYFAICFIAYIGSGSV